jgi:transcriptional regulator with XRE-family HTH domain
MVPDVEDAGIEDFYALVGSKVRSARLAAEISQEFLANKVGLTRSSVANLEAGRQRIALHLFAAIAHALNKDACELLPERSQSHRASIAISDLQEELADSPESMQSFVRGAVARLGADDNGED